MNTARSAECTIRAAPREPRIELPHPLQVAVYRRMSVYERLSAGAQMSVLARSIIRGYFASQHPEWSEEQIRAAIAQRMLGNAL